MEKKISAYEARRQLGNLINEVQYGGDTYIIERHGQPAAVLVSVDDYAAWREWQAWRTAQADAQALQQQILERRGGEVVPSAAEILQEVRSERQDYMP